MCAYQGAHTYTYTQTYIYVYLYGYIYRYIYTYLLLPTNIAGVRVELRTLVGHRQGIGTRERRLVEDALLFHCTVDDCIGVFGGIGVWRVGRDGVVDYFFYETTYEGIFICVFVWFFTSACTVTGASFCTSSGEMLTVLIGLRCMYSGCC